MKQPGLLLAAAVIIGTNAIVLVGVDRNRAGGPLRTIQLTERELPMSYRGKEDSGISLRLQFQRFYISNIDRYAWLDQPKLESLGFDCAAALRDEKRRPLSRPAFIVLEFNGPAWEQWLQEHAQQVPELRNFSPEMQSRLLPIDAAKTSEPLLAKYADHQKYLIVRGIVQLSVLNWDPKTIRPGPARLQPSIFEVLPDSIHVPLPIANAFAGLTSTNAGKSRYTVTLAYGHRFEPWVVAQP